MPNRPRFNLKNKTEETTLISMIFRIKGKRIVFSTGLTISPKNWNDTTMRARSLASFVDSQVINEQLSRIEEHVRVIDREFRTKGEIPSIDQFKNALSQRVNGVQRPSQQSFNAFIEAFIRDRSNLPNYSPASVKVYRTTMNHYLKFIRGRTIEFKDITLEHLDKFVRYLRNKGHGDNYVHKLLATLRAFLNDAFKKGMTQKPSFSIGSFKVMKRESDTVYLSMEELKNLECLDLSNNARLARARDLFLIGAFTGLRYSDFTKISLDHIKVVDSKEIITVAVTKTQDMVEIPLHPIVKRVLNRNQGEVPRPISNQKLNDYLKELGKMIQLDELITKREYPSGEMKVLQIPKWQMVSSHTARRSFATNAHKSGIPDMSIMKITGHKQYTTFMRYIRVSREENAVRMSSHPFFEENS